MIFTNLSRPWTMTFGNLKAVATENNSNQQLKLDDRPFICNVTFFLSVEKLRVFPHHPLDSLRAVGDWLHYSAGFQLFSIL